MSKQSREITAFEDWRNDFLRYGIQQPRLGKLGSPLNGRWPANTWLRRRIALLAEQRAKESCQER